MFWRKQQAGNMHVCRNKIKKKKKKKKKKKRTHTNSFKGIFILFGPTTCVCVKKLAIQEPETLRQKSNIASNPVLATPETVLIPYIDPCLFLE